MNNNYARVAAETQDKSSGSIFNSESKSYLSPLTIINKDIIQFDGSVSNIIRTFLFRKNYWAKIRIALRSFKLYYSSEVNEEVEDLTKTTIYNCVVRVQNIQQTSHENLILSLYHFKYIWDIIVSFILVYNLITIPYRINYYSDDSWFLGVETFFDVILFLDAFYDIRFNLTKVTNEADALKMKWKDLFDNTMKFKLIFQIMASIPIQYIFFPALHLKLLRFISLPRALTVIEELLQLIFVRSAQYSNQIMAIITFTKTLALFFFITQVIANYWAFLALNLGSDIEVGAEGDIEINTWVSSFTSSYNQITGSNPLPVTLYIESLFFVIQTFSTVGYGDFPGHRLAEYFYQMFMLVIGGVLYAILNSSLRNTVAQAEMAGKLMTQDSDGILLWLIRINNNSEFLFQDHLWIECRKLLMENLKLKSDEIFRHNEFFSKISPHIQYQILRRSYSKFLNVFSNYFEGVSEIFIFEFLLYLDPKNFEPHSKLLKEGTQPDNVYFMMDGPVFITIKGNKHPIGYLDDGDVIGDNLILFEKESNYSYRSCVEHSILCFILEKKEFLKLKSKFPNDINILKYNINKRIAVKGEYRRLDKVVPLYLETKLSLFTRQDSLRKIDKEKSKLRKRSHSSTDFNLVDEGTQIKTEMSEPRKDENFNDDVVEIGEKLKIPTINIIKEISEDNISEKGQNEEGKREIDERKKETEKENMLNDEIRRNLSSRMESNYFIVSPSLDPLLPPFKNIESFMGTSLRRETIMVKDYSDISEMSVAEDQECNNLSQFNLDEEEEKNSNESLEFNIDHMRIGNFLNQIIK